MKAITICNPYPELIMRGDKRVENRNQNWFYRGQVLIHAGASHKFLRLDPSGTMDKCGIPLAEMKFGFILGVADIVDCVRPIAYQNGATSAPIFGGLTCEKYPWLSTHPHAEGPYCLILDNVKRFRTPIPARGMLGLWDFKGELPEL